MKPTGNVAWIPEPRPDAVVQELVAVVEALLARLVEHGPSPYIEDRVAIERAAVPGPRPAWGRTAMTRPTSRRVAPAPRRGTTATGARPCEHGATHAPVCPRDPARMSPAERRAELGALLAAGFARQLENLRNGLAGADHPSPVCEAEPFDGLENRSNEA